MKVQRVSMVRKKVMCWKGRHRIRKKVGKGDKEHVLSAVGAADNDNFMFYLQNMEMDKI